MEFRLGEMMQSSSLSLVQENYRKMPHKDRPWLYFELSHRVSQGVRKSRQHGGYDAILGVLF